MALTPYQKLSGDEIRRRVQQNRENGEVEAGFETEEDAPLLFQHASKEDYDQHVLKQKMHALEIYTMKTPVEVTDRSIKAEEFRFQQIEQETLVEKAENKSESQSEKHEFKIGNQTEIQFKSSVVETTVTQEPKTEPEAKSVSEKAPSSLSEFTSGVDFKKWGKKGIAAVFGFMKSLFGGLLGTVKQSTEVYKPKTKEEQKAEEKKAKQNAEKNAFYQRAEKAVAEARGATQAVVAKTLGRLGLSGMSGDMMNSYLGENRNLNSEEINVYTAFEIARKAEEAKKKQEKQVQDMKMAEASRPTVNIDAAVEGGTGGGKANLSAVSAGG